MGFPSKKCWSGLPFPSAGVRPYPWIEPKSPASSCTGKQIFLPLSHLGSPKELRNVLKVELGEYEEGVLQAKKKLGFVHEDS